VKQWVGLALAQDEALGREAVYLCGKLEVNWGAVLGYGNPVERPLLICWLGVIDHNLHSPWLYIVIEWRNRKQLAVNTQRGMYITNSARLSSLMIVKVWHSDRGWTIRGNEMNFRMREKGEGARRRNDIQL